MARLKKYSAHLITLSAVILILSIAMGVYFMPKTDQTAFYSNEFGLIEIKSASPLIQQTFFQQTRVALGDRVTVKVEGLKTFSPTDIDIAELYIYRDGNPVVTIPITNEWGLITSDRISISYTPNRVGDYTANARFVFDTATESNFEWITQSDNVLTVDPAETPCSKNPNFGNWYQVSTTPNGVRQDRDYNKVNSDCEYYINHQESRTVCDSGYVISGTSVPIGSGYKTCELVGDDPEDPQCDADVTVKCDDGEIIVIKLCDSGFLVDTGNECQEIIECVLDSFKTCADGKIIVIKECVDNKYVATNAVCSAEDDEDDDEDDDETDRDIPDGNIIDDFKALDETTKVIIYIFSGLIFVIVMLLILKKR